MQWGDGNAKAETRNAKRGGGEEFSIADLRLAIEDGMTKDERGNTRQKPGARSQKKANAEWASRRRPMWGQAGSLRYVTRPSWPPGRRPPVRGQGVE